VTPSRGGRRLRVYYAVQICVAPISIRMFVNDPKLATKQYTDFMTRALRERFGLEHNVALLAALTHRESRAQVSGENVR